VAVKPQEIGLRLDELAGVVTPSNSSISRGWHPYLRRFEKSGSGLHTPVVRGYEQHPVF